MKMSRSAKLVESINSLLCKNSINEASLGRIWQHLTSPRAFAMLTAFRAGNSKKENRKRNKELTSAIREAGYGYFPIEGHYPELPDNDTSGSGEESNFERLSDVFTSGVRRNLHTEEDDDYDNAIDVTEESFFVIDDKNDPVRFREIMTSLGAKFGQDSIFYKDPQGRCYFLYTRNAGGYRKGQRQKINGDLLTNPETMGRFFSKVKGRNFTFDV